MEAKLTHQLIQSAPAVAAKTPEIMRFMQNVLSCYDWPSVCRTCFFWVVLASHSPCVQTQRARRWGSEIPYTLGFQRRVIETELSPLITSQSQSLINPVWNVCLFLFWDTVRFTGCCRGGCTDMFVRLFSILTQETTLPWLCGTARDKVLIHP